MAKNVGVSHSLHGCGSEWVRISASLSLDVLEVLVISVVLSLDTICTRQHEGSLSFGGKRVPASLRAVNNDDCDEIRHLAVVVHDALKIV
jgi:hypothetical protein